MGYGDIGHGHRDTCKAASDRLYCTEIREQQQREGLRYPQQHVPLFGALGSDQRRLHPAPGQFGLINRHNMLGFALWVAIKLDCKQGKEAELLDQCHSKHHEAFRRRRCSRAR